jgi:L-glyceraldehyde 3-phosphate reductase
MLKKIRALKEVAAQRGQTLAEMALAWILRDGDITSVLIGASKPSQIIENIGMLKNMEFSQEERAKIDEITA